MWTLTMHYGEVTEDLYEFSEVAFNDGDIAMVNYYTSMHPESIFRKTFTIQRITAGDRVILRPKVLTRYRDGVRTDTPIEPAQIRQLARELFGIELDDAPLLFEES
jgi:arylamine N-acetyltransferase